MSDALPEQTLKAIRANAEMAISELAANSGVEAFGYNESSIAYLEHFIEGQRHADASALISVLGSFLGEANIAATGGVWASSEHGIGVQFANGDWCFPFAKVQKQFLHGAESGDGVLGFYRTAVERVSVGSLRP